jgi:hypothetical protein
VVKPQICGCGCGFQVDIQYRKLAVVVLTMIPKTTVLPQPNLPSPSQLLRKMRPIPAKIQSPMTSIQVKASGGTAPVFNTKQNDMESINPPILQGKPRKKQRESIVHQTQPEIIEIPDDTPPEIPGTPIVDAEHSMNAPSPLLTSNPEQFHPKRKASQDETHDSKRFQRNPFVSPFRDDSPKPFKEISAITEKSDIPMIRTWFNLNADWDDADIDMIEEFKDFVDFI